MPAYEAMVDEPIPTPEPDRSGSLMMLGLIAGMAVCALCFAAMTIRPPFHPVVIVTTSALVVPGISGFVAGVIGRRLASALGIVLLALFAASDLSGLWMLVGVAACSAVAVGATYLGMLAARRSRWALLFPVLLAAALAWQASMIAADRQKFRYFRGPGLHAALGEVGEQLMDVPGAQWRFRADNDVKAPAFIATGVREGCRFMVRSDRDNVTLQRFEVDVPSSATGAPFSSPGCMPSKRLGTARAYLLALGFHPSVADALRPVGQWFYLELTLGGRPCEGRLDPSGALRVSWGMVGR